MFRAIFRDHTKGKEMTHSYFFVPEVDAVDSKIITNFSFGNGDDPGTVTGVPWPMKHAVRELPGKIENIYLVGFLDEDVVVKFK